MARELVYDISHFNTGEMICKIESYVDLNSYLIWHGIAIWWYSDGDIDSIKTYNEDIINGVKVRFDYNS